MRKIKIFAVVAALALAVCGCGPTAEAETENIHFGLDLILRYGSFSLYEDTETGVQYFTWKNGYAGGICPRYNADGTLYVEG